MKKILLIEDDISTIELYEKVLEKAGFALETIMLGKEGLKRLNEIKEGRKEKPDLILLDLILPDLNGIKILEEAKKEEETKSIPFFILTNYINSQSEKNGQRARVEKYILKTNVTPLQLVKEIKKYLKTKK